MTTELYEYLKKDFYNNNISKYHKYFEMWVNNLTTNQIFYYKTLWMK